MTAQRIEPMLIELHSRAFVTSAAQKIVIKLVTETEYCLYWSSNSLRAVKSYVDQTEVGNVQISVYSKKNLTEID